MRTTDGGSTWTFQQLNNYNELLRGVSFFDINHGIAVGYDSYRTTDGGTTWHSSSASTEGGVSFFEQNKAIAVGDEGTIILTTDGGITWTNQTSGTYVDLLGVSFTDANNGTVVGKGGTILRTTDGGTTWISQISGTTNDLYGVSFIDANNGIVVGANGTILRTYNGGGIIPVEFNSFTATASGDEVKLKWSTATETNNKGFEVQSKTGNNAFKNIAFINGHGTSTQPHKYSYTDTKLHNGEYMYRIKQIDFNGKFEYSKTVHVKIYLPKRFLLSQNFPDPFNPVTTINYSLLNDGKVVLKVFDMLGKEVITLVNENQKAGDYSVKFNGSNLPSGVYIYRIQSGNMSASKKMILLK